MHNHCLRTMHTLGLLLYNYVPNSFISIDPRPQKKSLKLSRMYFVVVFIRIKDGHDRVYE